MTQIPIMILEGKIVCAILDFINLNPNVWPVMLAVALVEDLATINA